MSGLDTTKLSRTQKGAINYFKKREKNFQLFHLDSYGVKKVCAAWPNMTLKFTFDNDAAPLDVAYKWTWAWQGVKFDPVELACLTGLREQVLFALDICIGNKLIYPDGTVNKIIMDSLEILYTDADILLEGLIEKG